MGIAHCGSTSGIGVKVRTAGAAGPLGGTSRGARVGSRRQLFVGGLAARDVVDAKKGRRRWRHACGIRGCKFQRLPT